MKDRDEYRNKGEHGHIDSGRHKREHERMSLSMIDRLKVILREEDCPFFTDEELDFYLYENRHDFNKTAYQCLILKSESTNLVLSGLETADTSKYFRRIAQRYRGNNSRVLGGG